MHKLHVVIMRGSFTFQRPVDYQLSVPFLSWKNCNAEWVQSPGRRMFQAEVGAIDLQDTH